MTKNLMKPVVPANVLEQAIPPATLIAQRNWMRLGLFGTPIPPAVAGKPRLFPLLGAYEAGLLGNASVIGIPLEVIAAAFRHRIDTVGEAEISQRRGSAATSFWEGEVYEAAARSGELREFDTRSSEAAAYWLINLAPRGDNVGYGMLTVSNRAGLPEAWANAERHKRSNCAILTICVTDVVTAIDNELRKLGIQIEAEQ